MKQTDEAVFDYEDIISIDKRIRQLNQEITHLNKIFKHYKEYRACLNESPDLTFMEYIHDKKEIYSDERSILITKRNNIIKKYQED